MIFTEEQDKNGRIGLEELLSDPETLVKMIGAAKKLNLFSQAQNDVPDGVEDKDDVSLPDKKEEKINVEKKKDAKSVESELSEKLPDIVSAVKLLGAGNGGKQKHVDDKRIRLLLALRPYLSDHRRDVVDYIIRMNDLGEMIKNIF